MEYTSGAVGASGSRARFNVSETERTFRGMALKFGAPIDCYPPTIFRAGAFARTLAEQGSRTRILWQHDQGEPIGRPKFRETGDGLEVVGELDPIPQGDRALVQLSTGTITDLSIGWDPVEWQMVRPEQLSKFGARPDAIAKYTAAAEPVRVVLQARLWEVSLVTFGAQPAAKVAGKVSAQTQARMAEVERIIRERREANIAYVERMAKLYAVAEGGKR